MSNDFPNLLPKKSYWIDKRLLDLKHNEFAWRCDIPENKDEWREHRDFTRSQLALAAGLTPQPDFPELHPKIWGHTEHEGVIIAKVAFESMPGLICTGSLFLPKKLKGKAPGVLCPYGHWQNGRFHHHELGSIPLRGIMFARLGFVCFCYDMIGKCDNNQILHYPPLDLQRTAELYGVSLFGLQTWNSIRALDFLCDLPEVDANRIGCTGASGGASQTWTVSALDERIKVIAPVCMLSSHYQGGCVCEEGPLLRLNGVTSFDVLSACAPRPLFLPSVTQDWTNLNPVYEYEAVKRVYALFKATGKLGHFHADAPHNYNRANREHVYAWFVHWLMNTPYQETIAEPELQPPPIELLAHSLPTITPTTETTAAAFASIQKHVCADACDFPDTKQDFASFRKERIAILGEIINNDLELADIAIRVTFPRFDIPNAHVWGKVISRRDIGDVIPAYHITHTQPRKDADTWLLLSPRGKRDFLPGGICAPVLDAILKKHDNAIAIDLIGTGETADMLAKSPRDTAERDFYAFNPSLFSMRVQDILTTLAMLDEAGIKHINVVAIGEAARVAACALPLANPVKRIALDLTDIKDTPAGWMPDETFQPLIFKIGGLKGALALLAPVRLTVVRPSADITTQLTSVYDVLENKEQLTIASTSISECL